MLYRITNGFSCGCFISLGFSICAHVEREVFFVSESIVSRTLNMPVIRLSPNLFGSFMVDFAILPVIFAGLFAPYYRVFIWHRVILRRAYANYKKETRDYVERIESYLV